MGPSDTRQETIRKKHYYTALKAAAYGPSTTKRCALSNLAVTSLPHILRSHFLRRGLLVRTMPLCFLFRPTFALTAFAMICLASSRNAVVCAPVLDDVV